MLTAPLPRNRAWNPAPAQVGGEFWEGTAPSPGLSRVCEILAVAKNRLADTLEREDDDCAWEAPEERQRSASEEQAESLLHGVRLMLAEEALSQLWEGCLRPKTAAAAVVDCWANALNYN